jgi:hypothetical protein
MYYSWADYPYYRDLIYGQNYFGDPALKIHLTPPRKLEITMAELDGTYSITVTGNNQAVSGAGITVSLDGTVLEQGVSDEYGRYVISTELDDDLGYDIGVVKEGHTAVWETYVPSCVLDVDDNRGMLPLTFALHQNRPNPFNPLTTIEYSLAERCDVQLDIYNILGQSVAVFVFNDMPAGRHSAIFDGKDVHGTELPSGIYFYRLRAGGFTKTMKMALIR